LHFDSFLKNMSRLDLRPPGDINTFLYTFLGGLEWSPHWYAKTEREWHWAFKVSIEYLYSSHTHTWRSSTRQFKRKLFGKDRPGIIASHHVKESRFSETFIVWLQSIRPDAFTLPHAVLIDSTALVVLAQSSSGPGLAGQSTRHLYFWILVPDEYEMNSLVLVP
jgi:hypothetical protein